MDLEVAEKTLIKKGIPKEAAEELAHCISIAENYISIPNIEKWFEKND